MSQSVCDRGIALFREQIVEALHLRRTLVSSVRTHTLPATRAFARHNCQILYAQKLPFTYEKLPAKFVSPTMFQGGSDKPIFQRMKSRIGRNAQCWSNLVGHSVHTMAVVNKKFVFQRAYDVLSTSVFGRVGVLRELLCARYGYCSQTLPSVDEMNFVVEFLCLQ